MLRALAAISCFFAAVLVGIAGWAEILAHRDTPESLEASVQLQQRIWGATDASILERLAERRRWDLHDRDLTLLREAVRMNPRLTSARIRLGLAEEAAGNVAAAERTLLDAARYDRQHLPVWTLANYYYRREQANEFWEWASRAAERTYDDFRPLLRLADTLEPASLAHLRAGAKQPAMERAYLNYLIGEGRLDAAESVALRLAHEPQNRPRIADLVDRDIRAGRITNALELWNRIGGALDPLHDRILTNGGFEQEPSGIGFDWKLASCTGVTSHWSPARMEFEFTGAQPDTCILLEQPVPLPPGRDYAAIIDSTPLILTAEFDVVLRIVLRRTAGTVPFQGNVVIRSIRIQAR